jgi:hypothetical protein
MRITTSTDSGSVMVPAAIASAAAGLIHATVIGLHVEQVGLARLFIAAAVLQIGAAILALIRPARLTGAAVLVVNLGILAGWIITRAMGIAWIEGLERAQAIGFADAVAAAFATVAVIGSAVVVSGRVGAATRVPIAGFAVLMAALAVPAVVSAATHDHDHGSATGGSHAHGGSEAHGASGHDHGEGDHRRLDPVALGLGATDHHEGDHHEGDHGHEAHEWPRPWDPDQPFDFSGVPGVSAEQQARAEQLVADTLEVLPRFADVTTVGELGFRSIGDARTGFEHFINIGYIGDDNFLDPNTPESLVYRVDGDDRTLVSAMFIASGRAVDDPELTEFGGALMEWHVHDNLCWGLDDNGVPAVKAVTDNHGGVCPPGTVLAGGENPMVHVWITPHECGPFAALEGHGAGQTASNAGSRADQCAHDHDDGHGDAAVPPTPYDPELPIDLGGVAGVSLQQQAFAENLVAVTLRYLPQWEDPAVAEAAGFRSIGDGGTGHEHYIQWDWIDDEVWLDPNSPESLVYEPQPDGSKKLVAAMYMLPGDTALADIPDWGGRLMQWHVHDDLCFTSARGTPRVGAVVGVGGQCPQGLVKMNPAPMIHVWIRAHECGPFAALDGIGAGQVIEGEEHFCNTAHGAGH